MSGALPYAEALAILEGAFAPASAPIERIALGAARGRVLAEDLVTVRAVPGYVHSAMDGYAVRGSELATGAPTILREHVALMAGDAAGVALPPGHAARIMTGAALPPGADTVVVLERARRCDADSVELAPGTCAGANVRSADDDFAPGAVALAAGTRLAAAELGVAAALGLAEVAVRARPRVVVLVTGDELLPPGAPWRHGRRYDSNGTMLTALCVEAGLAPLRVERVPDDAALLAERLAAAGADADLVLTTGGASSGDLDLVPATVRALGTIGFWRVAIKPGMPTLFGHVAGTPLFALPGNPVSVYAMFAAFVRPALARWLGCAALDPPPLRARVAQGFVKRHGRYELRRGRLVSSPDGVLEAVAHPSESSGALSSIVQSNALLLLDAGVRDYPSGTMLAARWIDGGGR